MKIRYRLLLKTPLGSTSWLPVPKLTYLALTKLNLSNLKLELVKTL